MAKVDKQVLINSLKHYHDCSFTPGVYEHSIMGQAALLLEKSEEVVRCKDCKSYVNRECKNLVRHMTNPCSIYTLPNDFCSYGERGDGE